MEYSTMFICNAILYCNYDVASELETAGEEK